MKCEYCEIAKGKLQGEKIYEDKKIVAILKETAVTHGHVVVFPKKHYVIMEMVPDSLINYIFNVANKLRVAIFESLGVQGTNIIVQNGTGAGQKTPHFSVEIIPRREEDGLQLDWKPKQLLEEEMDLAFTTLKGEGNKFSEIVGKDQGQDQEEEKEVVIDDAKTDTEAVLEKKDEENYLLKSLNKIP